MKTLMRGHVTYGMKDGKYSILDGGTLVFFFEDGHAVGLELFRDWIARGRPDLVPGNEIPMIPADAQ